MGEKLTEIERPEINIVPGAEENGLALILSELIRQNIEKRTALACDFREINCVFKVTARDKESLVSAVLSFKGNQLTIYEKAPFQSDVEISGSYEAILSLSKIPLIFGVPNLLNSNTFEVLKKILVGELRISGITHLLPILRLLRVISVS